MLHTPVFTILLIAGSRLNLPCVQITVTVLILLPEVQTEDRGKSETAKAIARKGRLRLGRNALVYFLGSEELHKLSKCPDRTGPPGR